MEMITVLDKTTLIMMHDARFDVFTAVVMNIQIFWDLNTVSTGKQLHPCSYGTS
jgi:hypothetical protein